MWLSWNFCKAFDTIPPRLKSSRNLPSTSSEQPLGWLESSLTSTEEQRELCYAPDPPPPFPALFPRALLHIRSFWWVHMRCVSLEWRTDWINCECSLFTSCSWLRRRNKNKIISSLCCIVGNTSWLIKSRSLRAEDWVQNPEPGIAKPVALLHHSDRIVGS